MKKKKLITMVTAILLCTAMMINFSSCSTPKVQPTPDTTAIGSGSDTDAQKDNPVLELTSTDLMSTIVANDIEPLDDLNEKSEELTDFAVRLFRESEISGENTLISPLSVLCALSMTANGAKGKTLAQMEEVLGMSVEELNDYVHSYMNILTSTDDYKLNLANAVWFTNEDHFSVNQDFLQTNADYYGADIYSAPFDDSTKDDINSWVCDKTDEMIEEILKEIPEEAVMYLVNALAFDAKWEEAYEEDQIRDDIFTAEDGTEYDVEMMYSVEDIYLEDDNAVGFAKYYKDGKYAFAALLPDEGISVSEYIESLNGEKVHNILTYSESTPVSASIPKFESKFDTEMSEVLKAMGMTEAFSTGADFTGLGTSSQGNIKISKVLHKTYISVDESGTKAAAATVVEMEVESAAEPIEMKEVHLDRPFVYMLIDCETNIPFFIGTMMQPEA